ncbi:MAG TPA: hypothetical protein VFV08_14495 [Puia sp.]|nr:hypothetical protein [Puia sp.]
MAKKLILVNEDMYKTMLNKQKQQSDITKEDLNDEDAINLNFIRRIMKKAKEKRGRNMGAKNIAYNQELRRYLKLRKEVKDKPLKVELSNLAKLIMKKPEASPKIPKKFRKWSVNSNNESIKSAIYDEDDEEFEPFDLGMKKGSSIKSGDLEKYLTPRNEFYQLFNPNISAENIPTSSISAKMKQEEEAKKETTPKKKIYPQLLNDLPDGQKIYDYIMIEPEKFNFNAKGNVVAKGNRPLLQSNIARIIEYHLMENTPGNVEPTGYKTVAYQLKKNQYIKDMVNDYKKRTKNRRSTFKPSLWK